VTRRERWRQIIFEADTRAGRVFDLVLLAAILLSVLVAMLESVAAAREQAGTLLLAAEWLFTVLFTLEYVARLAVVERPLRYARSFFGIVDLMSFLPAYLSFLVPGAQGLMVIRSLRILRIFRILKLAQFLGEQNLIMMSLRLSRPKILVFMATVLILDVILGSAMYVIEGESSGFTSIPVAVYWAIVTMTTVGYGDISPVTPLGQALASLAMLVAYSILAVPTGIITAQMLEATRAPITTRVCPHCTTEGHLPDARFCKDCGERLDAR